MTTLPRFVVLYAAMYAAYGVSSPFFPALLGSRGLPAEQLGLVLGAATAIRLVSAPVAGRIGDRFHALRAVLLLSIALAAFVTLGLLVARGFWAVFAVALLHAAALAPMTVLADALAVRARGFEYGWVRGTGSAAFIAGALIAGQAVGAFGLDVIVALQALLLGGAAFAAFYVPEVAHDRAAAAPGGIARLLRLSKFRILVLLAALVLGSHAMHDGFAVIRWSAAGISPAVSSLLWTGAVAGEVLVFFVVGPMLVRRLSPAGAMALAAVAGTLRWVVMAQTTDLVALALVQPLHGIKFGLLHLSCMRVILRTVPQGLEGTAQAVYATLGIGGATAVLLLASGALYARFEAQGFWIMAALCVAALPLAWRLRGA